MNNHIVKVFTKGDELYKATTKVNSGGSFILPWGAQPKIVEDDCYIHITPHLELLDNDTLKEIYLKLQDHTYAGYFVARHALGVLYQRGIYYGVVTGAFHEGAGS